MSGERFLVGLWDVTSFEEIIKIKCLLKDLDMDNTKFGNTNDDERTGRLLSHRGILFFSPKYLSLSDDNKEVAVYNGVYIAKKWND